MVILTQSRRPGPGPKLLAGPDLRQPAVVLPGGSGGGGDDLGDRPTVEADELPVVAGGVWRDESRAARDGHQLLVVVGGERCVQRVDSIPQASLVVEIQYALTPPSPLPVPGTPNGSQVSYSS